MGCVPRLGGMEGSVAMTGCVGDRADNRDNVAATVVGRRRSVEGPGSTKFNRLVRAAASNHRGCGVDHSHLLARSEERRAGKERRSGGSPDHGTNTMTGSIGYSADNHDRVATSVCG